MADGVAQFDYLILKGTNLKALIQAAKEDPTKLDEAAAIVDEVLPMAYAEIEKVIGDGSTINEYICYGCSFRCEGKAKFDPPIKNLCWLKGTNGADYQLVNSNISKKEES